MTIDKEDIFPEANNVSIKLETLLDPKKDNVPEINNNSIEIDTLLDFAKDSIF
jgi:hypothetical protein